MILAKASLAMIVNYNCNHSFIVLATDITIVNDNCKTFILLATVITIVNYDNKTFIVQATGTNPIQEI